MNQNIKKIGILILLLVLIMPYANSQTYYADLKININQRGDTTIRGQTNVPNLIGTHQNLTTKTGQNWIFNLSTHNFSNALFDIKLPEDAVITYIKSTAQINIFAEQGQTHIKGIIQNKPLELIIQYHFQKKENQNNKTLLIISIILIIIGIILMLKKTKKEKPWYYNEALTKRQKQIITILEKNQEVNQKFLEQKLNLPKSSISRNILTLEKKGIITKKQIGYSNIITLNKTKQAVPANKN